ncbi:MAG: hypothetical protein IKN04_23360 [Clostridia bacterium]|nr:hypothetical protein [Clostridia bacterium]
MIVRRMLLVFCLLCFAFSVRTGKTVDVWTVEPFSGSLSGKTITVTRRIWAVGTLTRDEPEGSLRSEIVFALRCLRMELPDDSVKVDGGSGYMAVMILSDQETVDWLLDNAWRFGLIVDKKPEGPGERIRLRYVGPVHAAAMHALDMDLEDYLLFLRRTGQTALNRNGRAVAWIIRVPEGEAVSFTLPEGAAWEISGDSAGGVIIAVRSGC